MKNVYTESFFNKKNSNRRAMKFDTTICNMAVKSFLKDLQYFLKNHGFLFDISDYCDGLSVSDDYFDNYSKLKDFLKVLSSYRKNVITPFKNDRMILKYGDCIIIYNFFEDDCGNSADVVYQDNVGALYRPDKLISFINETPGNNVIECGENYVKSNLYSTTVSVAKEIFGDDISITTKMGTMFIDFPEDYTESCDDAMFTEASLNDSDMFQQLNKSSSIMTKLKKVLKESVVLDQNYIEEQYLQITKTRLSPLSEKVIKAFDNGEVRLLYSQTAKMTTAIPFIILQLEGKMTACIFISDFCSMNKDGTMLNMEMKKLYTLMESAYVGLKYFTNPVLFTRSSRIAKVTASIYSEMALRILNREFALSLDKDSYDTVNYLIARFCLSKVLPLNSPDLIHAYAVSCCKSPTNLSMELASDMYDRSNIHSMEDLIKCIAKNFPKMAKLTFRYYFERWISSFGTGTCLAVDSFPYLYYTIVNVLLGAFLVNVTGLSEIVKNTAGMNQFYAEITRVC